MLIVDLIKIRYISGLNYKIIEEFNDEACLKYDWRVEDVIECNS